MYVKSQRFAFAFRNTDNYFQTFKKRAAEIADHAHNPRGALGEGAEFLRGLDETERQCKSLFTKIVKKWRPWFIDRITQYSVLPMKAPRRCVSGLERRRRNDQERNRRFCAVQVYERLELVSPTYDNAKVPFRNY